MIQGVESSPFLLAGIEVLHNHSVGLNAFGCSISRPDMSQSNCCQVSCFTSKMCIRDRFTAVEMLAKICKRYKQKYPLVRIALHTATADIVDEMMNKGLVDVALFMEPVDTEGLDYIRIKDSDHWVVGIRPDDPLAEKKYIEKKDLLDKPLILPERMGVQSELANWFGKDFSKLDISFISNLGTNAGVMAANGLGYPISCLLYTSH